VGVSIGVHLPSGGQVWGGAEPGTLSSEKNNIFHLKWRFGE